MSETMAASPLGEFLLNFSIDLYKQLISQSGRCGNFLCSPFVISAALSMALAGARTATAKQLSNVLHVKSDAVHEHFSSLFSQLSGFAPDVKLHVVNRMYAQQSCPILDAYLSLLQESYSATIESVDFQNYYRRVEQQINSSIEEATESKIRITLPYGSVDNLTILILVNAMSFKGFWNSPFDPNCTVRFDFHLDPKNKEEVDMMYEQNDYKMSHSDKLGVTALEIPYRGGKTSMVVLLPDSIKGLSKLEKRLTATSLAKLLKNLNSSSNVKLYLPKFELKQRINLKQTLRAMGINNFFTPAADLSGITGNGKLMASGVFHSAFVEVTEEGTEAAAATAVRTRCCELPTETRFVVDHPFMFLIRSLDPDIVLFMGSVRQL